MNQKFLEAYRNLENELRCDGLSVLDYENSCTNASIKEKIKICRITRNYMSHQDTNFVMATKDMVVFLTDLSKELRLKSEIVKTAMKKVPSAVEGSKIKELIPICAKHLIVPIVNKKTNQIVFTIDADYVIKQMSKGVTKLETPKKLPKLSITNKEERISNLQKGITYVVTSDGTSEGKYVGMITV